MDIALAWDPLNARGDWSIEAGQLALGDDLASAILISLFSDRVLPDDQLPPDGTGDRRGWWADTYRGQPLGSRLWTLERGVKSNGPALLASAKDMCLEALSWLVSDGVAARIDVTTFWLAANKLGIMIKIAKPTGTPQAFEYAWSWQGIA